MSIVCNSWYKLNDVGSHKDHEVKLIKKAISQVKGEYSEIVAKVG